MRTTVVLEDRLFREAKRQAARRGITLSQLVNEALRSELARRPARVERFEMLTFGGVAGAHREPADFAAALEDEEQRSFGR